MIEMNGKRAALGFRRSQLLYDIENCSYIEGDILDREDYNTRRVIQDVGQRGNVDQVTRIIDLCVSRCRERLYPFTKREVGDRPMVVEDVLENERTYWITLSLPTGFSETTVEYLGKLIHEYIVCMVMYDWMSIVQPKKREIWREKGDGLEDEIKRSLKGRTGKIRRSLHPF